MLGRVRADVERDVGVPAGEARAERVLAGAADDAPMRDRDRREVVEDGHLSPRGAKQQGATSSRNLCRNQPVIQNKPRSRRDAYPGAATSKIRAACQPMIRTAGAPPSRRRRCRARRPGTRTRTSARACRVVNCPAGQDSSGRAITQAAAAGICRLRRPARPESRPWTRSNGRGERPGRPSRAGRRASLPQADARRGCRLRRQ